MRKTFSLIIALVLGFASLSQAQDAKAKPQTQTQTQASAPALAKTNGPKIVFKEDSHSFGTIKEGIVAEYEFSYTNTGKEPLVLTEVRPSCGCTTPSWSKEPLMPGKTATIKVMYNSAGRPGKFNKSISVTSNDADGAKVLFISGEVEPSTDIETNNPNQSPVRVGN